MLALSDEIVAGFMPQNSLAAAQGYDAYMYRSGENYEASDPYDVNRLARWQDWHLHYLHAQRALRNFLERFAPSSGLALIGANGEDFRDGCADLHGQGNDGVTLAERLSGLGGPLYLTNFSERALVEAADVLRTHLPHTPIIPVRHDFTLGTSTRLLELLTSLLRTDLTVQSMCDKMKRAIPRIFIEQKAAFAAWRHSVPREVEGALSAGLQASLMSYTATLLPTEVALHKRLAEEGTEEHVGRRGIFDLVAYFHSHLLTLTTEQLLPNSAITQLIITDDSKSYYRRQAHGHLDETQLAQTYHKLPQHWEGIVRAAGGATQMLDQWRWADEADHVHEVLAYVVTPLHEEANAL